MKKADNSAISENKGKQEASNYHKEMEKQAAEALGKQLAGQTVVIKIKCGENGKTFGSVGSKEIAEELNKKGFNVDKRKIAINENIKTIGSYQITAKLHPQVSCKINVEVVG